MRHRATATSSATPTRDATLLIAQPVVVLHVRPGQTLPRSRRWTVLVVPELPGSAGQESWLPSGRLHAVLVPQRAPATPPTAAAAPSSAPSTSTATAISSDAPRTVWAVVQSEWHMEHDGKWHAIRCPVHVSADSDR